MELLLPHQEMLTSDLGFHGKGFREGRGTTMDILGLALAWHLVYLVKFCLNYRNPNINLVQSGQFQSRHCAHLRNSVFCLLESLLFPVNQNIQINTAFPTFFARSIYFSSKRKRPVLYALQFESSTV